MESVPKSWTAGAVSAVLAGGLLAVSFVGCTPAQYRQDADRETYQILSHKTDDPRWQVPLAAVDPPVESRLADPSDPDRPPMPPDDPTAHHYMHRPGGLRGYRHWYRDGQLPWVENPAWQDQLAWSEDGTLQLSPERAMELALLNSREYQLELENLYLTALALTLERFDFDLQWFGGNVTDFFHFGAGATESRSLATTSFLGFSRSLAAGGQLLADLTNTFVWQFAGTDSNVASSNITLSFLQPLLRGFGRDIRLEGLTQSERNVLYAARGFARFRKQFYVDVVAGRDGYLALLLQMQNIRNLEANLESLEQNLRAHEALAEAGLVSPLQVDQVFQSYQFGQLALIRARNDLETSLDSYKIRLGLPPDLPIELDDSMLAPFQLTAPLLTELEGELEQLLASFRELDEAPPIEVLEAGFGNLQALHSRVGRLLDQVQWELQGWQPEAVPPVSPEAEGHYEWESAVRRQVVLRLTELEKEFQKLGRDVQQAAEELDEQRRAEGWGVLQRLIRNEVAVVSELFVMQTQVRVYLVELPAIGIDMDRAVEIARDNRLDLMNESGLVVDSWRKIRLAANQLRSDLNVTLEADIGTDPGSANPLKFSAKGTGYRAGLQFDGPLNRMAERNIYRAQLIQYQRGRRSYMALEDRIVQAVRLDLRELRADRLNFEIARQSLITAARQVEMARDQLLAPDPGADSSTTQDALLALNSLLQAKNNLIAIWIAYETHRLQLLLDTESLQLDPRGVPIDEFAPDPDGQHDLEPIPLPAPAGLPIQPLPEPLVEPAAFGLPVADPEPDGGGAGLGPAGLVPAVRRLPEPHHGPGGAGQPAGAGQRRR